MKTEKEIWTIKKRKNKIRFLYAEILGMYSVLSSTYRIYRKEQNMENTEARIKKYYSSTDLLRIFQITRKTLFYYDRAGLLKPIDRIGKKHTKVYDEEGYQQMKRILQYRESGLKIEEIRLLMNHEWEDKKDILENALMRLGKDIEIRNKEMKNLKILIAEHKDNMIYRNEK